MIHYHIKYYNIRSTNSNYTTGNVVLTIKVIVVILVLLVQVLLGLLQTLVIMIFLHLGTLVIVYNNNKIPGKLYT